MRCCHDKWENGGVVGSTPAAEILLCPLCKGQWTREDEVFYCVNSWKHRYLTTLFSRALLSPFFAAEESDDTMAKDICSERVPKIGPCSLPKYCSLFMRHTKEALIIERRPHRKAKIGFCAFVILVVFLDLIYFVGKKHKGGGWKCPSSLKSVLLHIKCQGNYEDCLIGCQVV